MKKLLSILLVLLAATTLFAADASLGLATTITGTYEMKISQASALTLSTFAAGGTSSLSSLTSTAVTDLFVNIKTNKRNSIKINVTAPNLKSAGTTYEMVYVVTPSAAVTGVTVASAITSATTPSAAELLTFATNSNTGLRVLSHGFGIDLDDEDYANAVEGDYTATITFDIVVL
jgi:hypothetical protein